MRINTTNLTENAKDINYKKQRQLIIICTELNKRKVAIYFATKLAIDTSRRLQQLSDGLCSWVVVKMSYI